MNSRLEVILDEVRGLSEAEQESLADLLPELLADLKAAEHLKADMRDKDYRAYVSAALAESEADVVAGRFSPADETFHDVMTGFRKQHDLGSRTDQPGQK